MKRIIIIALLLMLPIFDGVAKEAVPMAKDPVVELRMNELAEELRCLVCQNQSLAASDSDFANDLRREIRDMIYRGLSDQEIVEFMVQRYGDFILFRPPVKSTTILLWFGPLLLMVIGLGILYLTLRRRRRAITDTPLSADELKRAESLLSTEGDKEISK